MPTFRVYAPSQDLVSHLEKKFSGDANVADALRRALASRDQANSPLNEFLADKAAADTVAHLGAARKANAEAAQTEASNRNRVDPVLADRFAAALSNMTDAEGRRMGGYQRGEMEQPAPADIDDAAFVGKEAQPYPMAAPNVPAVAKRAFVAASAIPLANQLAAGHSTAEQLIKAAGEAQQNSVGQRVQDLIESGELDKASALSQGAKPGTAIKLFNPIGNTGAVMAPASGAVKSDAAGNPLLETTLAENRAKTANQNASAALHNTQRQLLTGGGSGDEASQALPGGKGSKLMQEPDSGAKYAVNEASGRAWKATDKGWEPVLVTNLPKNLSKFGSGSTQGNRESIFTQRVIMGANQASKDLGNVTKLPLTASTGILGGRKQGPGLLDAGREVLANKMTSQEAQQYNVMSTGFQRSLAAIESAGLMPSGALTHQMDAVLFKEGDTNLTKLHKLAQTRQIVESGMETVLNNPRVSEAEKKQAREIVDNLRKAVPFSHGDLIKLQEQQAIDSEATLKDVIGKTPASGAAPSIPPGWKIEKVSGG